MTNYIGRTRKELKQLRAKDFKEGTTVAVGKYRILIQYGQYELPLCTVVYTKDDLRDIPLHKLPYYIQDFI